MARLRQSTVATWIACALACVSVATWPRIGRAEPPVHLQGKAVVPSDDVRARAARLTKDAEAAYRAENYARAGELYRRAYATVPAPELLFNLGQCQRLLSRPGRAQRYFEAYLRVTPDSPHKALVEQLIAEAKQQQATPPAPPPPSLIASASTTASRTQPPAAPPGIEAARVVRADMLHIEPLDVSYVHNDLPPVDEGTAIYERWWFWTGLAVLAGAGAATAYLIVNGQNAEPEGSLGTVRWE